jgi:hypothetical protein
MNIATGSVINMTPAPNGAWSAVFQLDTDGDIELCPVIGWATVVTAHLNDGSVSTEVKPAFVWGAMVWTETELREHTPTLTAFDIRRLTADIPA